MGNRLRKDIDITVTPGYPGSPGSPGSAATPSRSGKRTKRVCHYEYPSLPSQNSGVKARKVCRDVVEIVKIPASAGSPGIPDVPGRPGVVAYEYHIGWNGRARSVAMLRGDGYAQFTLGPSNVGVVVGLSFTPQATGYSDIVHGVYANRGRLTVYEGGKPAGDTEFISAPVVVRVERIGPVVGYYIGDELVHESAAAQGPMFLASAMYSGGDVVDDASIVAVDSCNGRSTMRPMMALGASGITNWNFGECVAAAPLVTALELPRAHGVTASAAPVCIGGDGVDYNQGRTSTGLPNVLAMAHDLAPEYCIGINTMRKPGVTAISTAWELAAGGNTTEALFTMGGDYAWDNGTSSTAAPICLAYDREPDEPLVVLSRQLMLSDIIGRSVVAALLDTRARLRGLFVITSINRAALRSALLAEIDLVPTTHIRAILQSLLGLESLAHTPNDVQAWVLHTDVGGMTRYENYDFTSFAKVGDRYFGTRPDGIYLLEGGDDAGVNIEQRVNFGSMNFGTSQRKAMPYVYVGMASTGDTFVRVTSDDKTFTYRVRDNTQRMKEHRYELGRGLRGTFYEVELVSNGSMFDLESIEFFPMPLQRRL